MTTGARSNELEDPEPLRTGPVTREAGRPMMKRRDAFAAAYLACFAITGLVYAALSPRAQAALTSWASTSVANLEHEPAGPLVVSAFLAPGYFLAWPALILLALPGAGRALGSARAALVCAAGHVIGTLVSEGIVAYRVDAGQLPAADRHLIDVGPSYLVVSAIVIAVMCGSRLARAAALADLAVLVFPGHIFGGLSRLDVAAVGHLTAAVTAAAVTAAIMARRRPSRRSRPDGSRRDVTHADADQVGDPGGDAPQYQLP
jgi:Rhomboid-like protein